MPASTMDSLVNSILAVAGLLVGIANIWTLRRIAVESNEAKRVADKMQYEVQNRTVDATQVRTYMERVTQVEADQRTERDRHQLEIERLRTEREEIRNQKHELANELHQMQLRYELREKDMQVEIERLTKLVNTLTERIAQLEQAVK